MRAYPKRPLSTYSFRSAGGRGQQGHAARAASAAERASTARARRRRGHLRRRAAAHAHHLAVAAAAWPAAALLVLMRSTHYGLVCAVHENMHVGGTMVSYCVYINLECSINHHGRRFVNCFFGVKLALCEL